LEIEISTETQYLGPALSLVYKLGLSAEGSSTSPYNGGATGLHNEELIAGSNLNANADSLMPQFAPHPTSHRN